MDTNEFVCETRGGFNYELRIKGEKSEPRMALMATDKWDARRETRVIWLTHIRIMRTKVGVDVHLSRNESADKQGGGQRTAKGTEDADDRKAKRPGGQVAGERA